MHESDNKLRRERLRRTIGERVRALRFDRGLTQAELARTLGLSQSRLSEIERGGGSFTAEQLLTLLRTFNIGVSHFDDGENDPDRELQDALARFGARHLYESNASLAASEFEDIYYVIEAALTAGTPRLVTALAPVLLENINRINLARVQVELIKLGRDRRLPWLLENVRSALDQLAPRDQHWSRARRLVDVPFRLFLDLIPNAYRSGGQLLDVLDATIRSQKSLDEVNAKASPISKQWGVATSLDVDDFVHALEASRAAS